MGYLIAFIVIAIVVTLVRNANRNSHLTKLKWQYEQLLKGTDRRAALAAGREYYGALRRNRTLTIYDEQAIANDLSTMRE